jgi:hypothetical protein
MHVLVDGRVDAVSLTLRLYTKAGKILAQINGLQIAYQVWTLHKPALVAVVPVIRKSVHLPPHSMLQSVRLNAPSTARTSDLFSLFAGLLLRLTTAAVPVPPARQEPAAGVAAQP